ncbi:hypothetical protein Tco_0935036 [Tanacetum coccineum]
MKEKDVDDVVEEQILTIKLKAEDSSKKLMKYKLKITNSVDDSRGCLGSLNLVDKGKDSSDKLKRCCDKLGLKSFTSYHFGDF